MAGYPDPEEEYELMYADEFEMIREQEAEREPNIVRKPTIQAKRSLDFSNHSIQEQSLTPTVIVTPSCDIPLTPNLEALSDTLTAETTNNKRTADELFGDIDDINFEETELPSKRQKTEEENDMELIEKILISRKIKQSLLEPSRIQSDGKPQYNVKENISLNIPRWAFLPVTNSDGDRMYVKYDSEEYWDQSLDTSSEHYSLKTTYADAWVEARKILESKQESQQTDPTPDTELILEPDINGNSLWVDKYRPQSYVELLTEEPVNRALLHWLHLWDKIVFKKEVKTREPQQRNSFHKRTGQFQLSDKWRGKREETELDQDGRPTYKVALLCGPPGVGKTTLAHLLAKQAGYRPVELNASDERSTEAFRTAIQNATSMRSVIDADRRPNCLILDEIDGAPLPTVELLVKWCTATTESGKKKNKIQPLKRPIIAICNELYATALRPLRPVSTIIQVHPASIPRVTARLCHVADSEKLTFPRSLLNVLGARSQGDVRQAVNLLRMMAGTGKQLTLKDVENVAIGSKDCSKSMMQALNEIFSVNDDDPGQVLRTIQAAGEYDRLSDGIFEHYLSSRVDSRLLLACETTSWLLYFDIIQTYINKTQNYSMYGLLPYCLLRCNRVLGHRSGKKLRFPMQAQEMRTKRVHLQSILSSVCTGSSPHVAGSRAGVQLDIIPMLPYILTPKLRSANVQLCSSSERASLSSCARALCDYGLQYTQQRTGDGLYAHVLEPDIYSYAFFGNEDRARPPPAIRQAIAREQQLEVIRRNEEMAQRMAARNPETSSKSKPKPAEKKADISMTSKEDKEARLPNHLQRLKPKEVEKSAPQVHKDFFGRIVPLSQMQRSESIPDVISSSSVFYQYREGYNNAVRKNVRGRDLL